MSHSSAQLDLGQLRAEARVLLEAVRDDDPDGLSRAGVLSPADEPMKLSQALSVIAREHGFASWAELRRAVLESDRPDRITDLFSAVDSLDLEQVQRLLVASPNLAGCWRRTDYSGWESALHVAAKRGSLPIAKALVEAGAEVYAVRQSDYPPVFEAHYSRNPELVEYLLAASAERDHGQPPTYGCGIDIVCASRLGMLDRVLMHLERDPFAIYRRGCIGETVLHWPSHNGYVEVVEALLTAGAVIEADEIGLYGGKPLHWASEHSPTTVRVLLAHGANPRSRNVMKGKFEGFTSLHMCASQREQSIENAQMLLEAGSDPSALDAAGETPLDVSRRCGHDRMAAFLEGARANDR